MLRVIIAIIFLLFRSEIRGISLQQILGHYEYNCYYNDENFVLDFHKISCHDLTITEKEDNCFDGYSYDYEGKKSEYHIDIISKDLPRIYNNGKQIDFSELHSGDVVMIYTDWQIDETGAFDMHCNGFVLSWVKQIELIKCPHNKIH